MRLWDDADGSMGPWVHGWMLHPSSDESLHPRVLGTVLVQSKSPAHSATVLALTTHIWQWSPSQQQMDQTKKPNWPNSPTCPAIKPLYSQRLALPVGFYVHLLFIGDHHPKYACEHKHILNRPASNDGGFILIMSR